MASRSGGSSLKAIVFTLVGGLMLFTLPSLVLLGLGMLPTFVAMMVDQRREKYATLCVACMNFYWGFAICRKAVDGGAYLRQGA